MPADDSKRRAYGHGRVALIALLDPIRDAVERGHPLGEIYREHQVALGVTYAQFAKLLRRYLDVVPLHRRPREAVARSSQRLASPGIAVPLSAPVPSEPQTPEKHPSKGSQEWRQLHGIPDDRPRKPAFVARVPNLKWLIHGEGEPEQ